MVAGKLANQRQIMMRARREGIDDPRVATAIDGLRLMTSRIVRAEDPATLMGMEGHAANLYFGGFAGMVRNPAFSFTDRNRRPPRDPINACLSFGYAMLLSRAVAAVWGAGLDPHVGMLHEPGRGKPALALDLMEEFRPLIDRLVLRLINRRQLGPADFIVPGVDVAAGGTLAGELAGEAEEPPGASVDARSPIWLGPSGRGIVVREVLDLWRTAFSYPQRGGRHELQSIIEMQAQLVAAVVEGREAAYVPFAVEG
jgi:CRISPR-associated protein Cas1